MSGFDNDVMFSNGIDLSGNTTISNQLGTDGFIYIGNSSGNPVAALPTSSDNTLTITPGNGSLDFVVDTGQLGLGTMSEQNASSVDITGGTISGIADLDGVNLSAKLVEYSDCMRTTTLDIRETGTGATTDVDPGTAEHPGVVDMNLGTTTSGKCSVLFTGSDSQNFIPYGGGTITAEVCIYIDTLASASEDYTLQAGCIDNWTFTSDTTDGGYFEYKRSASTNWYICTANNGTRTKTETATAVASGWNTLKIVGTESLATYYINGTNVGTVSTNLPVDRDTNIGIWVGKSAGTTSRTFKIDYLYIKNVFTTAR